MSHKKFKERDEAAAEEEAAEAKAKGDEKRGRPRKKKHDATQVAGMILDEHAGQPRIAYIQSWDTFAVYEDGAYRPLPPRDLERFIWMFIMDFCKPTAPVSTLVKETVFQMKQGTPRIVSSPVDDRIVFLDGTLDLTTFRLHPHDPEEVCVRRMPFSYADIQAATSPVFDKFLRTVLVDPDDTTTDPELIAFMQEIFGYVLMTKLHAAAAFFFVGEGANGKSKMSDLIRAMVGDRYVSAMTLENLTMSNFAASALVGKYLNMSNEEESKYMKSDKFKALVTGDYMTVERKFGDPFEFAPQVKLIFSTNEMPTFDGVNHGVRRRIKIVPFHHTVTSEERDPEIVSKMLPEMAGIIRWAIEGAKRLRDNGFEFTEPASAKLAKEDFEEESSSVVGFFKETYDIEAQGFQPATEMYKGYQVWCPANGKKPVAKIRFFKDLLRMFPALKTKRARVEGRVVRGYNIGFAPGEGPVSPEDVNFK